MKSETLTAAAMQSDSDSHKNELLDLIVCIEQIKHEIFCPSPKCGQILDIGRAIMVTPIADGNECRAIVFCGARCASQALKRTRRTMRLIARNEPDYATGENPEIILSFKTITPACFKQSFPHVRLRPEPKVESTGAKVESTGAKGGHNKNLSLF